MNLPRVQTEMQEHSFWRSCHVQDIDTFLTSRCGENNTFALLYCDLYVRRFKESLKKTMLEQESAFEDQIHELHRLYQRQKELMMEMEGTNNLYSQPRHLFPDAVASSPRASVHWMSSTISTSKTSVLPPEDAFANTEDESDKSGEKVLGLDVGEEEEEEGLKNGQVHEVLNFAKDQSVVQPEDVQNLSRSKYILDLNEPAKIEEHSDYELNQFLSAAQTMSERAEPEVQDPSISTKNQAENGIDLNTSPSLSSEEVKMTESEQPPELISASLHGKHGSESSRAIVQALPCLTHISLFHKRSSCPRKKAKRRAKSTTVKTYPRSKTRKGSNLDSNLCVNEDDNHSLSTASDIPESDHIQEQLEKGSLSSLPEVKSARKWTNPRKTRLHKPHIETGKVMRKTARTKSKARGSFLATEEQEKAAAAAEAMVDMSLSGSARESSIETSDRITPLRWFANIASSAMALQLTEMKPKEQRTNRSVSIIVPAKHKRTPRRQGKRQQQHEDQHNEILSSLSTFTGNEASQDLNKIERLIEASETKDARSSYCSLMDNMVIDWGTITKRRRGIRIPKLP